MYSNIHEPFGIKPRVNSPLPANDFLTFRAKFPTTNLFFISEAYQRYKKIKRNPPDKRSGESLGRRFLPLRRPGWRTCWSSIRLCGRTAVLSCTQPRHTFSLLDWFSQANPCPHRWDIQCPHNRHTVPRPTDSSYPLVCRAWHLLGLLQVNCPIE